MEWLSRQSKRLILEMSVGIVLYNLVFGILAWTLLPKTSYPVLPVLKGLLVGAVGAILMLVHMAVTTERVLDSQNESYANKTTVVHGIIRKLVFIAALLACWRWFHADILAAVIGAMGMKAGAYLQPMVHKISCRGEEPTEPVLPEPEHTDSEAS